MTLNSKVIRVNGGANRESGCSAMLNSTIGHNVTTAAPRQRCGYRNTNRDNAIQDNRVSGWRT
ncbi:hypothetical protein, partial [Mycobacterium colombiense]|uniref:hypothetical protein n=1 Tax=Mycobacterium colombiense TaxID=339268 RepID=UPI00197BF2EC